jgi:hypothetical protein
MRLALASIGTVRFEPSPGDSAVGKERFWAYYNRAPTPYELGEGGTMPLVGPCGRFIDSPIGRFADIP